MHARPKCRAVSLGCGEFPENGPVTFRPNVNRAALEEVRPVEELENKTLTTIVESSSEDENVQLNNSVDKDVFRSVENKVLKVEKCASVATEETLSFHSDEELFEEQPPPPKSANKIAAITKIIRRPVSFERRISSFMRTADLGLNDSHSVHSEDDDEEIHENFHHPSVTPPPGMDHDANESWVALDNGTGCHSPIAPLAIQALAQNGLKSAFDKSMWTPDRKTDKLLRNGKNFWKDGAWQRKGHVCVDGSVADETQVLVWTGSFKHGFWGHDIPAVRSTGIVDMAPRTLFDLLLDSSRVNEYNKMSLGRKDLLVMQANMDQEGPFGKSITKVIRSENRPPLIRKILRFVSIMHAKELDDGSGYYIVTRAVSQAPDSSGGPVESNVLCSEILLGVTLLRRVEGEPNKSVMTNVNHLRSPMVPMMIAKKIGLSAACGFFDDIRKLC